MLLQRKSLAFVAPSGEKYLIFMFLKVRKWAVTKSSPAKNYRVSTTYFATTKETALAPFNLAHPVIHTIISAWIVFSFKNIFLRLSCLLDGRHQRRRHHWRPPFWRALRTASRLSVHLCVRLTRAFFPMLKWKALQHPKLTDRWIV